MIIILYLYSSQIKYPHLLCSFLLTFDKVLEHFLNNILVLELSQSSVK